MFGNSRSATRLPPAKNVATNLRGGTFARILCTATLTSLTVLPSAPRSSAADPASDSSPAIRRLPMPKEATLGGAAMSPGQSAAVVVDDVPLVHTAQVLPVNDDHDPAATASLVPGEAPAQIARVYERLEQILRSAGSSSTQIVKLNVYVANASVATAVRDDLAKRFAATAPAVCFVETTLPLAGALFAVDAVAAVAAPAKSESERSQNRVSGVTLAKHSAITPSGPRVYVAGQAEKGDLRTATRKTLESLEATLRFLRLEWADVAQVKSFVTPMSAVRDADDETRQFFSSRKLSVPPLVWVEWQSGLPIEIELVAAAGRSESTAASASRPTDLQFLTPPGMTTPTIYSRVTRTPAGSTIFVSGLYGTPNSSGGDQVERIFAQLKAVLAESGSDLEQLAKATYYVSDNDASAKLNELRPRYYNPKRPPAASKAQVVGVALPGTTITLDMIAVPRAKQ